MARPWDGFEDDKPHWKERRGHLLQFPDHIAMEKENSSKNLRNQKKKERAKNLAVTTISLLKKSRPQDLVSQGTSMHIMT